MPEALVATQRISTGHVNLRGDPADPAFLASAERTLGAPLPVAPNTAREANGTTLYWLGPDEWLVATGADFEGSVADALNQALVEVHASATAVGGGLAVVELGGALACEVLSKECPLDLDARAYPAGRCAQSRLAKAPILLRRLDAERFELVVRLSFAGYLRAWLDDAAGERGIAWTEGA